MQPPFHHFGALLDLPTWTDLAERLKDLSVEFMRPRFRFAGQTGEQATLFTGEQNGNALEVKAFSDSGLIFKQ